MARIGLVGFFGWGNYGDELFLRQWQQSLGAHHEVAVVHDQLSAPYFSRQASEVAAEFDAFVIGGGDLVIPNKISPLYWNRAWLQRPVYISGVGVPTWIKHRAPDVIERLRNFFQHPNVKHVSARDEESAQWIRRHLEPRVSVRVHADLAYNLAMPPPDPPPGCGRFPARGSRRRIPAPEKRGTSSRAAPGRNLRDGS